MSEYTCSTCGQPIHPGATCALPLSYGFIRPDTVWVNEHTNERTTITRLDSRVERVPAVNGGFRDDHQTIVHHTLNAPPGLSEGYGDEVRSFIEHWRPLGYAVSSLPGTQKDGR